MQNPTVELEGKVSFKKCNTINMNTDSLHCAFLNLHLKTASNYSGGPGVLMNKTGFNSFVLSNILI